LRNLAQELGIAERVDFLGYRSDVGELLADYDIFCSASRWEGLPLTVVEAAAAGLPLVLSDIPQMHEVVTGDEAAFFPPGDAEAAARAIRQVMADYDPALTVAAKAGVRIRQDFSIQRMVGDYAEVYETVRVLRG